jgi:hypothetical protein
VPRNVAESGNQRENCQFETHTITRDVEAVRRALTRRTLTSTVTANPHKEARPLTPSAVVAPLGYGRVC